MPGGSLAPELPQYQIAVVELEMDLPHARGTLLVRRIEPQPTGVGGAAKDNGRTGLLYEASTEDGAYRRLLLVHRERVTVLRRRLTRA
jgi:hypothetical protein